MTQDQEGKDHEKEPEQSGDKGTDGDRADRDAGDRGGRDHPLGGDRYAREFQQMSDRVTQMARDAGIDVPDRAQDRDDRQRSTEYHLMNDFSAHADSPFSLGAKLGDLSARTEYVGIMLVASRHDFIVTSSLSTSGHNTNSLHYKGRAADVRTFDRTNEEVDQFIHDAKMEGISVRDERVRPQGQKVWDGPHLHLSVPEHWHEANDRSTVGRDQQSPNSTNETRGIVLP